jgi:hypothetical protein
MVLRWSAALVLYVLGCLLMIDNIRAQPHEDDGKRGYSAILWAIVALWPIVVLFTSFGRKGQG